MPSHRKAVLCVTQPCQPFAPHDVLILPANELSLVRSLHQLRDKITLPCHAYAVMLADHCRRLARDGLDLLLVLHSCSLALLTGDDGPVVADLRHLLDLAAPPFAEAATAVAANERQPLVYLERRAFVIRRERQGPAAELALGLDCHSGSLLILRPRFLNRAPDIPARFSQQFLDAARRLAFRPTGPGVGHP